MRVRTEARRDLIIEKATALFREMGFERATMSELAQRCGGSKATLYGYFPSKEELFVAVVKASSTSHLSEAVTALTQRAEQQPIKDALTQFGQRMLYVLTNDADALAVYRMVVAEAGRSVVGDLFYSAGPNECILSLAELFAEAIANNELRNNDPHILAKQFLGLVTAETDIRLYQQHPAPVTVNDIQQMVERAVDMFLHGAAV
jgi:AcrR family transcriptional regulator